MWAATTTTGMMKKKNMMMEGREVWDRKQSISEKRPLSRVSEPSRYWLYFEPQDVHFDLNTMHIFNNIKLTVKGNFASRAFASLY